jgi:hypothetical protein
MLSMVMSKVMTAVATRVRSLLYALDLFSILVTTTSLIDNENSVQGGDQLSFA